MEISAGIAFKKIIFSSGSEKVVIKKGVICRLVIQDFTRFTRFLKKIERISSKKNHEKQTKFHEILKSELEKRRESCIDECYSNSSYTTQLCCMLGCKRFKTREIEEIDKKLVCLS